MIRLRNSLKNIYKNKRSFCKKPEIPTKLGNWFDRHIDPNLVKINDLTFKNIDLEIEIMRLRIEIKELDKLVSTYGINKEINKILSESNTSKKK